MSDWLNIPVKTRIELLREYKKQGYTYSAAKSDFENSYKSYQNGGEITNPKPVVYNNIQPQEVPSSTRVSTKNPQFELELLNRNLLKQELLQKSSQGDTEAELQFRDVFGTSTHRYKYDNDPNYKQQVDQELKNWKGAKINYPSDSPFRQDAVPYNMRWMYPQLTDESQKVMGDFSNEVISSVLPIPLVESVGKVPSVFKIGRNVIKDLPKLEEVPFNYNLDNLLKKFSTLDQKNMKIMEEGNKYFKELNNPESLKRLKEFGDEYEIDLINAYKKAEERWDYGTNIGKHDRFQVGDINDDYVGLSTTKRDIDDSLEEFYIKSKYGEDSGQMKNFEKNLSQNKSINYINKDAPLEYYSNTVWHELAHDINKAIIDDSPKLKDEIKSIFIDNPLDLPEEVIKKAREFPEEQFKLMPNKDLIKSKRTTKQIAEDEYKYVTRPTELWSFLSTNLRQDLKNTGIIKDYNELLTSKKLEEAIKNGNTVYSRFAPYIKDRDKFIKLFNKMTLGMTPAILYFQSQQNETEE